MQQVIRPRPGAPPTIPNPAAQTVIALFKARNPNAVIVDMDIGDAGLRIRARETIPLPDGSVSECLFAYLFT